MLSTIPPREPEKRRAFFMTKLTNTSSKLKQLMDSRDTAIDALFADIDKSVLSVRESLNAAEVQLKNFSSDEWNSIRRMATLRDETECPICCAGFETATQPDGDAAGDPSTSQHTSYDSLTKRPILLSCSHVFHHGCLLAFERFAIASSALDGDEKSILHSQQRQLESLHTDSGDAPLLQPPPTCRCPLCRSNYQKVWL